MKKFDIGIIGSGSAGYVGAIKAAQLGKKICLIEKDKIGGACLNEGCIPTKTLLASVDVLESIKTAEQFGIKTQTTLLDFPAIIKRKTAIIKRLTGGINFLLKQNKVEVIQGIAKIKEPGCLMVETKEIEVKSIIICSGSVPFMPVKIHSGNVIGSKEALELEHVPASILIIGAGAIGVEFATMFSSFGAKVTLIEMKPSILPEIKDEEIKNIIRTTLKNKGVEIIEGEKVEEINKEYSLLSSGEKILTEKILVACGRTPASSEFEKLGLKCDNNKIIVNEKMCTNVDGIYAAGDVTGEPLLAHKASAEGVVAAENAVGNNSTVINYNTTPMCIFSNPEIASVGQYASELHSPAIGRYDFQGVGKAMCIGETFGFVKVVADEKGVTKGLHIVGPSASDLIQIGVIAIKNNMTADEIGELMFAHPTLSECVKEAFLDVTHKAIHKSPHYKKL